MPFTTSCCARRVDSPVCGAAILCGAVGASVGWVCTAAASFHWSCCTTRFYYLQCLRITGCLCNTAVGMLPGQQLPRNVHQDCAPLNLLIPTNRWRCPAVRTGLNASAPAVSNDSCSCNGGWCHTHERQAGLVSQRQQVFRMIPAPENIIERALAVPTRGRLTAAVRIAVVWHSSPAASIARRSGRFGWPFQCISYLHPSASQNSHTISKMLLLLTIIPGTWQVSTCFRQKRPACLRRSSPYSTILSA